MLPELRAAIQREDWSVHVFFAELRDLVQQAHRDADEPTLRRAYGFAAWCFEQPGRFLANASVISFYEHVYDDWDLRHEVCHWLPRHIAEQVRPLWEWRLPAERLTELDQLLGLRAAPDPQPAKDIG